MGQNHDQIGYKLRLKIHFRDCFCCRYCGKRMNPLDDDITIDHIDPTGDNSELNLVTCCQRCNSRKHNRHAKEFMADRAAVIEQELLAPELAILNTPGAFPPLLTRRKNPDSLEVLLKETVRETNIPKAQILGRNNSPDVVAARRSFCVRARKSGFSLAYIGKFLGKHHTTVMHLVRTAQSEINIQTENPQHLPMMGNGAQ